MTTGATQSQQSLDFQRELRGHIDQSACGRIEGLRVAYCDAVISLFGQAPSYHLKQIAQEAAFAFCPTLSLSNHISVAAAARSEAY